MSMQYASRWQHFAAIAFAIAGTFASSGAQSAEPTAALTPRMKFTRAIVEKMLDPQGISNMTLSPDGKHVAAIAWTGRANALMLVDADTGNATALVKPELRSGWRGIIMPLQARWISDDRLAVDFNDGDCALVGFDGRRGRVLGDHFLRMITPDKPDETAQWALVGAEDFLGRHRIRRVNVNTGESVDVPLGLPGELIGAVFDRGGHLRAATTRETKWFEPGAKMTNWYRHDERAPWQQLAQALVTEDLWKPIGVPDDSDTLAVLSREGRDTWAMFTYDVDTRRTTDMRVGHPTEDLVVAQEDAGTNTIRVMTHGLKLETYWFDARWDALQRSIDAALPGAVNVLSGDPHGKVLVLSYSDRDPGRWMVLNTERMTLRELGRRNGSVDSAGMRPMQTLTYTASDGLSIPAYLTLPESPSESATGGPVPPRPMVVYIHGGPISRDEWGWDFDVQMLAAAGYAVFQPQFRGSSGFGRKFEQAGYRQWGLAMQDDVTAGVKAMIERGVADPRRICIYGASYGGYAALWGLVKTPELYQCGVSLAGVSDIGERFSDWSDTNADKSGRELMRFAVGDIDTMAAQFDAVSPQKHASQIRVPVLLAHGTDDPRVPIGHSKRMAASLKEAHLPVETHWYDDEGHGLVRVADLLDFNTALLDFLDRMIGPASPVAQLSGPGAVGPTAASGQP